MSVRDKNLEGRHEFSCGFNIWFGRLSLVFKPIMFYYHWSRPFDHETRTMDMSTKSTTCSIHLFPLLNYYGDAELSLIGYEKWDDHSRVHFLYLRYSLWDDYDSIFSNIRFEFRQARKEIWDRWASRFRKDTNCYEDDWYE